MPVALVLAFVIGFGMGWGGSLIYLAAREAASPEAQPPALTPETPALPPTSAAPAPRPTSAAPALTATSAAAASTATPAAPVPPSAPQSQPMPTGHVGKPVGFAQLVNTPTGLEVMAVVTKMKGGVLVTVLAQNNGDQPVTVRSAELGPAAVAFRGEEVPTRLSRQSRRLAPGEALVYPCRVRLPNMSSGDLSFTVAGVQVSGRATGG